MRHARRYSLAVICALASAVGWAQGRNVGFDWPATSADAQRTAWLRLDPNISVENLSKPGFEFLWREKLDERAAPGGLSQSGRHDERAHRLYARVVYHRRVEQRVRRRQRHGVSRVAPSLRWTAPGADATMSWRNDRRCRPRRQPRSRAAATACAGSCPKRIPRWHRAARRGRSHGDRAS